MGRKVRELEGKGWRRPPVYQLTLQTMSLVEVKRGTAEKVKERDTRRWISIGDPEDTRICPSKLSQANPNYGCEAVLPHKSTRDPPIVTVVFWFLLVCLSDELRLASYLILSRNQI